jgi:superfamily I DNA/RNA helicase
MKFIPEQEAVFDAVRSDANVAVRAVAGSGKTTTIVEAAKYAPGRVAFVAFNVHIVEELRPRLPQNVEARTAHSLGLRILRQYVPDTKMEDKENRKYRTIFRDEYPQAFRDLRHVGSSLSGGSTSVQWPSGGGLLRSELDVARWRPAGRLYKSEPGALR